MVSFPATAINLTDAELRWCLQEPYRLTGERTAFANDDKWSIVDFNRAVANYRAKCAKRRFTSAQAKPIRDELTPRNTQALVDEGKRRAAYRTAASNARRLYVTDKSSYTYANSDQDSEPIELLERWTDLRATGNVQDNWVAVEWVSNKNRTTLKSGWVKETMITRGNGTELRTEYCLKHQGAPLSANELLTGEPTNRRYMLLRVRNTMTEDALVRVRHADQRIEVAFLVPAGGTKTINGLPQTTYYVDYDSGKQYSRGCGTFVYLGRPGRHTKPIAYDDNRYMWEVQLGAH